MRFLVILIVALAAVPAYAYETKVVGGPGGAPFELECPDSRSLAGLFLRFDETIAQLDAVCVATTDGAWRDQPRRAKSNKINERGYCNPLCTFGSQGLAVGGDEGHTSTMLMCPPNSLVYALNVSTAPVSTRAGEIEVVGRVEIHCVNPKTGREDVVTPIPPPEGAREYVDKWPADCRSQTGKFWATGLHGRAGQRIDALGLRCVSPNAPARPLREEALTSPPPVMAPVDPNKNFRPERIGRAPRVTPVPGAPPPATPPPAGPKSQIFYRPQAASYERLHACLYLPKAGCGRPAAVEFCKAKGFAQAAHFEVEKGRFRSETVFGELCRDGKCRVFTEIECAN
jgi:hypothetical protein